MNSRWPQFVRFCVVGAVVLALDFTLIWILHHFLPSLVAVSIAYLLAVAAHFLLNRYWVFRAGGLPLGGSLLRYSLALAACWASTVSLVWLSLHTVTEQVLVAKAIAVPPTTLLGFLIIRFYVFRPPAS
jgi:putative flippase GtrA